ncbi:hypothetical protein COLO4_07863 [Corchorus olitorius]|uniref:Uncharacterized protein n=1 Tax=Corchorus olitorius TaxID=93759 RepID=A0A1R3KIK2_9ROSI|nr:hypothetical protein COLO4_07863 [Corchorus olitorius]
MVAADKAIGNKELMINVGTLSDKDSGKVSESREGLELDMVNDESRIKVLDDEIVGESLLFFRLVDDSLINMELVVRSTCEP